MHEHLTRELFRAIHKGWRNPGDLAAIAMAHLFELCPHCRSEFEAWRGELGEGVARDEGDYDGALQRIRERTAANDLGPEAEEARWARGRQEARSCAEELLALPDDERLDWIRNEQGRHSGLLLAEALIEECRRRTPGYPHEGCALADLARVVLHHAPVSADSIELYSLALARLANALRVIGDLPRADQVIGDARYFLRSRIGGDRSIRAEVDGLESALRVSQFRFDEAYPLVLRALMVHRMARNSRKTAHTLLQMARLSNRTANFSRSLELLDEADHQLAEFSDAFLDRVSAHIRADALARSGRLQAATHHLQRSQETGHEDPLTALRARWLAADIARFGGLMEEAEEKLGAVRKGLLVEGLEFDVAEAELDLARIYYRQKRKREGLDRLERIRQTFSRLGAVAGLSEIDDLEARFLAL